MGNPTLNGDGIQDNMAINYVGPVVFTKTLLRILKESTLSDGADVRIVNVGSGGYSDISSRQLDYGSISGWNKNFRWSMLPTLRRYQYSKVAIHLWTNYLSQQMTNEDPRILVLLVHPGAILSDGAKRSLLTLPFPQFWLWLMGLWMYPQSQGAHTSVFAASAPRDNVHVFPGAYICPPNVAQTQKSFVLDPQRQKELIDFTEQLLKSWGV
ncbi:hypothetical protein EV360DRAFT_41365 [Lentinula raphanica]|nr:hypothetical protein EV360DRAFT_41365 [Lentinula raphanica]